MSDFRRCTAAPVRTETCLHTVARDERLLLFREGHIVVGAACSGHAFKFAPATGAASRTWPCLMVRGDRIGLCQMLSPLPGSGDLSRLG